MNNQEMLRVIGRPTLEVNLQIMRVVVNYRKGQKQLKKIPPHLTSTLARPPTNDRACPEIISTASPDNPLGVTKPSSLLLFVQPEKSLERSETVEETSFDNFWRKVRSESKLPSKPTVTSIA